MWISMHLRIELYVIIKIEVLVRRQNLWMSSLDFDSPLLEQICVRSCPDKNDSLSGAPACETVNQKEVSADVAFPVICPVAGQWMIQPLRFQWAIVGNEQ